MTRSNSPAPWWIRILYALVSCSIFMSCYQLTNWLASQGPTSQWYWQWEIHIPRIDALIIPYWSIDILFVLAFLLQKNRVQLRQLCMQTVAATLVACIGFLLWPLSLAWDRLPGEGTFAPLFAMLYQVDQAHNLFPSLHVAFAIILHKHFHTILSGTIRTLMHCWLMLITASTVLVHQHHLIDVFGGAALGSLMLLLIPSAAVIQTHHRLYQSHWRLAGIYGLAAVACTALAFNGTWWLLLCWPAVSFACISYAYLGKGSQLVPCRTKGPHFISQVLLFPWLEIIGWSRRWYWRQAPAPTYICAGVSIGTVSDSADWLGHCVDCSCEHRRRHQAKNGEYSRFPMLDLAIPSAASLAQAADACEQLRQQQVVLICCGLGLGRSVAVAAAWLVRHHNYSPDQACALLARLRPGAVTPPALTQALAAMPNKPAPAVPLRSAHTILRKTG